MEEIGFTQVGGKRLAYVFHKAEPGPRRVVIYAHGFKGSKVSPSRNSVVLARRLETAGVSTLRFDQPHSGDSEGDFEDSSFLEWVSTIEHLIQQFASRGCAVACLGMSMGGSASLAAASRSGALVKGLALWSCGVGIDPPTEVGEWMEEEGQRVRWSFWREVASFDYTALLRGLACPAYAVFGTADHILDLAKAREFASAARPNHQVRFVEGMPHTNWPEPFRSEILDETVDFLRAVLA